MRPTRNNSNLVILGAAVSAFSSLLGSSACAPCYGFTQKPLQSSNSSPKESEVVGEHLMVECALGQTAKDWAEAQEQNFEHLDIEVIPAALAVLPPKHSIPIELEITHIGQREIVPLDVDDAELELVDF